MPHPSPLPDAAPPCPALPDRRRLRAALCLVLAWGSAGGLAGCAKAPDIDMPLPPEVRNAPYPRLLPIDGLLARSSESAIPPTLEAELDARAARLRARAAGLRGPVIEPPIRARMQRGVTR